MRGVGTASGAITLVNALSTGIGCALAIDLPVRAEIDLRINAALSASRVQVEPKADTELVRETLAVGLARFAPGETFSGELRIDSHVPPGRGLKSSSAVGGAVLRAIGSALRQSRPVEELARLAAQVAQEIGLSATGAYDDCLAALRGGLVLSDNGKRAELRSLPFPLDLGVGLWIPAESHVRSTLWLERFRAESQAGRTAVEAARTGRWAEAMAANSLLVERLMGYKYGPLRADLLAHGAVMCGVTGMGPSVAALAPPASLPEVVSCFPSGQGEVRQVALRTARLGAGEGA